MAVNPRTWKLSLLVLLVAAAWVGWSLTPARSYLTAGGAARLVATLRAASWAPLVFVVTYIAATALGFSGAILTLAGGAVFGFWRGSALNLIGANLGANAAFWLARSLGRDGLVSLLGRRLAPVDRVSAQRGFGWLLRLRLIPLVPFNLLNFASGLTAMPWRSFAAATAIGIIPGTLVYTYFADALLSAGVERADARAAITRVSLALVALVLVSVLPALAKRAGWFARRP